MPTALITGANGQDGSYLAEFLLARAYEVHGTVRGPASNTSRIDHLKQHPSFRLHHADLVDSASIDDLVRRVRPDELYNLAAQSHVQVSFERPVDTAECNAVGCLRLLEAVRREGLSQTRFFQASSSELFGAASESPQNEQTPFRPRNPYASAKAFAFHIVQNFRDAFQLFAANGILFNHESPRRGMQFVTRKITRAAARIKLGLEREVLLGNLDVRRDWGHARDYVEAMWLVTRSPEPSDFVIATGQSHSVKEFLEEAFSHVGLDWREHVKQDPRFLRPVDSLEVVGNAEKAQRLLGWVPRTSFRELVRQMVDHDLDLAESEKRASVRREAL